MLRKKINFGMNPERSKFFFFTGRDPQRLLPIPGSSIEQEISAPAAVTICYTGSRRRKRRRSDSGSGDDTVLKEAKAAVQRFIASLPSS